MTPRCKLEEPMVPAPLAAAIAKEAEDEAAAAKRKAEVKIRVTTPPQLVPRSRRLPRRPTASFNAEAGTLRQDHAVAAQGAPGT